MVFARSWSCSDGVEPCSTLTSALNVGATPTLDLLAELGGRRLRFVLGAYSSPVPMGVGDVGAATLIGVRAGFLMGGEKVRGGLTGGGGFYGWEANGHLVVTPWRDRRGHRHGVALAVGAWLGQPSVTLGYRFAPAAWNHVGGRRAAKRRARGE
ncbi:MAG: hypothetical protein R3B09_13075 [Nannocystaceae bacterium]